MLYVMADLHGKISELVYTLSFLNQGDTIVLLGDAGLNFYKNNKDKRIKKELSNIAVAAGVTLLIVRGNHDVRPTDIPTYQITDYAGDIVYHEVDVPNLLFARDGGHYHLEGKNILTIGGAYSIDKLYRLDNKWPWFPNEQLSAEERASILEEIKEDFIYDLVFTHTCPYFLRPVKDFLNYEIVEDFTMEIFLEQVYYKIESNLGHWYCGHFHHSRHLNSKVQVVGIDDVVPVIFEDE